MKKSVTQPVISDNFKPEHWHYLRIAAKGCCVSKAFTAEEEIGIEGLAYSALEFIQLAGMGYLNIVHQVKKNEVTGGEIGPLAVNHTEIKLTNYGWERYHHLKHYLKMPWAPMPLTARAKKVLAIMTRESLHLAYYVASHEVYDNYIAPMNPLWVKIEKQETFASIEDKLLIYLSLDEGPNMGQYKVVPTSIKNSVLFQMDGAQNFLKNPNAVKEVSRGLVESLILTGHLNIHPLVPEPIEFDPRDDGRIGQPIENAKLKMVILTRTAHYDDDADQAFEECFKRMFENPADTQTVCVPTEDGTVSIPPNADVNGVYHIDNVKNSVHRYSEEELNMLKEAQSRRLIEGSPVKNFETTFAPALSPIFTHPNASLIELTEKGKARIAELTETSLDELSWKDMFGEECSPSSFNDQFRAQDFRKLPDERLEAIVRQEKRGDKEGLIFDPINTFATGGWVPSRPEGWENQGEDWSFDTKAPKSAKRRQVTVSGMADPTLNGTWDIVNPNLTDAEIKKLEKKAKFGAMYGMDRDHMDRMILNGQTTIERPRSHGKSNLRNLLAQDDVVHAKVEGMIHDDLLVSLGRGQIEGVSNIYLNDKPIRGEFIIHGDSPDSNTSSGCIKDPVVTTFMGMDFVIDDTMDQTSIDVVSPTGRKRVMTGLAIPKETKQRKRWNSLKYKGSYLGTPFVTPDPFAAILGEAEERREAKLEDTLKEIILESRGPRTNSPLTGFEEPTRRRTTHGPERRTNTGKNRKGGDDLSSSVVPSKIKDDKRRHRL